MAKFIFILVLLLPHARSYSQKYGSNKYFFYWDPTPGVIFQESCSKTFSKVEVNTIVNCKALLFEVDVILATRKIISVRYSKFNVEYNEPESTPILDKAIAAKLEDIFEAKLGISKVTSLSESTLPSDTLTYFFGLDTTIGKKKRKPRQ